MFCLNRKLLRVLVLFCGILLAICAGTIYGFGSYSRQLSKVIGIPNADLVGSMADLGTFTSIFGGLILDNFGRNVSLIYAFTLTFTGYFLCWLSTIKVLTGELWQFCIFFYMIGQGQSVGFMVGFTTAMSIFSRKHRGKVIGLLQATFVYGGVVCTLLYSQIFAPNLNNYFLTMAIMEGCIMLLCLLVMSQVVEKKKNNENSSVERSLVIEDDDVRDYRIPRLFKHEEFYYLWFGMFFTLGTSFMWKNVIATINIIVSSPDANAMIIVCSLFDGTVRVLIGVLQDYFVLAIPRPFWLVFPVIVMTFGHFSFLVNTSKEVLWFLTMANSFGTSAAFSMTSSLYTLYWGSKYVGINWGVLLFAPALAGTGFTFLATFFVTDCFTPICAQYIFLVSSISCSIAFVLYCFLTLYHLRFKKGT